MTGVTIANLTDFNASSRRGVFAPAERDLWQEGSDSLADMAVFWGGNRKVVVAPRGTDRAWLSDVARALEWDIRLVEPASRTRDVVDDLLLDAEAMRALVGALDGTVRLEAWGTTAGVLRLAEALRAHGQRVDLIGPSCERLWTVNYLDGKLALHDIAMRDDRVRVPGSATAIDFDQLMGLVELAVSERRPFVVKSNVGVGGFGAFIVDPDMVGRGREAVSALVQKMGEDPIFREGPFLVQDWIPSAPDALQPTFDGEVMLDGSVRVVGVGGMLVDGSTYRGVVVGSTPIPALVRDAALAAGIAVGEHAARLGFAGWYDVDFVLSDDGALHATEVNARRTSPTHAFELLARWQALEPRVRCVIADDHVRLARPAHWRELASAFATVEDDGTRRMATILRRSQAPEPQIGVAVGAPTYDRAAAALDQLRARLAT